MHRGRDTRCDKKNKRFKLQYHVQRGEAHQEQSIPDDGGDNFCYEFFNTSERNELATCQNSHKEKLTEG